MKESGGFGRITVGLTLDPHYTRVFPICVNSARLFITLNESSHIMGLSSKLMFTGVSPPLSSVIGRLRESVRRLMANIEVHEMLNYKSTSG